MLTLAIANDIIIEWAGLADATTGATIADATLSFTLRDADGKAVAGPIHMENAGLGTYRGLLPHTTQLEPATTLQPNYFLEVVAVANTERGPITGFRRIPCRAKYLADK